MSNLYFYLDLILLVDRGVPRRGYKILIDNGEIGHITSGTFSPVLKKNIGLRYVDMEFMETGKDKNPSQK